MMPLPLRLPAVCWHGKWLRDQETWVPRGLNSLRQANVEYDMKKIFTFDFHIYFNRDTSALQVFPVSIFKILNEIRVQYQ